MSVLHEMRKRIAIYGGTFDPVHSGHLEIARRVSQIFAIDEFLFVPARMAPHKRDRAVSPALQRYAMLALATREDPTLCISSFELEGPERQYTVDTLFHFRSRFGETADLFFVMGADSWAEITSWREWRRLLTLANVIVVTRPGYTISDAPETETRANIVDLRGVTEKVSADDTGLPKVFLTDAVMFDVSATEIRSAANGDDSEKLKKLVPLEVAEYIRKYQLYRNTTDV
ncbi:MAG TPA: nicotinate-nucleotide adenylyltransferase [Pyrinomonadaceae bacterium]|nr:nicotinate-nucleotide adenylyltransferase [Pyrinomonadaceae bacterium]